MLVVFDENDKKQIFHHYSRDIRAWQGTCTIMILSALAKEGRMEFRLTARPLLLIFQLFFSYSRRLPTADCLLHRAMKPADTFHGGVRDGHPTR